MVRNNNVDKTFFIRIYLSVDLNKLESEQIRKDLGEIIINHSSKSKLFIQSGFDEIVDEGVQSLGIRVQIIKKNNDSRSDGEIRKSTERLAIELRDALELGSVLIIDPVMTQTILAELETLDEK